MRVGVHVAEMTAVLAVRREGAGGGAGHVMLAVFGLAAAVLTRAIMPLAVVGGQPPAHLVIHRSPVIEITYLTVHPLHAGGDLVRRVALRHRRQRRPTSGADLRGDVPGLVFGVDRIRGHAPDLVVRLVIVWHIADRAGLRRHAGRPRLGGVSARVHRAAARRLAFARVGRPVRGPVAPGVLRLGAVVALAISAVGRRLAGGSFGFGVG